jgi:hypothetical protein
MKTIPLTQGKFAIVDDEDFEYLNQWKWHAVKMHNLYYAAHVNVAYGSKRENVFMHRLILKTPKGLFVDHRDRNGLNNQKDNLRNCTNQQNMQNRKISYKNKYGYKGIQLVKSGRWIAHISVNGTNQHIGTYDTPEQAARAYDNKAVEIYGEFARTNFQTNVPNR